MIKAAMIQDSEVTMSADQTMHDLEPSALIGRDPNGLALEYHAAMNGDEEPDELMVAEYRVMEALVMLRAIRLAPTRARALATALVAAPAMICRTLDEVDEMTETARDWIEAMGDPARHARAVHTLRGMGEDVPEARLAIHVGQGVVVLDVLDAESLSATLQVGGSPRILVGMVCVDDEGDVQHADPRPMLTA